MNKSLKLASLLFLATTGVVLARNDNGCCNGSTSCGSQQTDFTSHTFFSIRPQFQSQDPEKVSFFRADRMLQDCDGWGGGFQLAFFGGQTTKGKDLARWFFPFGKTELLVKEGNEVQAGGFIPRDIDPSHFNIVTVQGQQNPELGFESRISICPEQSVFGIGLDWKQMFTCKDDGTMGVWAELSFPITRVKNRIHLRERIIRSAEQAGGLTNTNAYGSPLQNAPANMTEAFRQNGFRFGRIDERKCDHLEKWGVADVEVKLGYNFHESECSHVHSFVGIIIPTGTRPNAVDIFEPILGHNDHFGFMIGGTYGYECWQTECGLWRVEADFASKYFLERCEVRSFDVRNKDWSRYMLVFANATDAANGVVSNGINVFTAPMEVSPRFTMNYNTAIIYEKDSGFSAELGYNFYARQAEKICLRNYRFQPQFVDATTLLEIDPARTIAHQWELEAPLAAATQYIPLAINDLDLRSAAHVAVITNTIYGGLNYDWELCEFPTFTNIGASYEFCANNAGLNRWTVWGKLGFSF